MYGEAGLNFTSMHARLAASAGVFVGRRTNRKKATTSQSSLLGARRLRTWQALPQMTAVLAVSPTRVTSPKLRDAQGLPGELHARNFCNPHRG